MAANLTGLETGNGHGCSNLKVMENHPWWELQRISGSLFVVFVGRLFLLIQVVVREGEDAGLGVIHRTADDRDHALTVHIFGGHSAGFGVLSGLRRLLVVVRLLVAGTPNDVRSKGAMHKTVQHAAGQDQAE